LPNGQLGRIVGHVTDAVSGKPLSGVHVNASVGGVGTSAYTDSSGYYSMMVAGNVAGNQYTIHFSKADYNSYRTTRAVPPGSTVTVNAQLIPHYMPGAQPYVPGAPVPVTGPPYYPTAPTPTAPQPEYELRIHFTRLPWANEPTVRGAVKEIVSAIGVYCSGGRYGAGLYLPPQLPGYQVLYGGLNWPQNYFSVRIRKVGSPFVFPVIPAGIVAIIITALVLVGVLYAFYSWHDIQKGAQEIQKSATETRGTLATEVTEAYLRGDYTTEQYVQAMKALGETVTVPEVPTTPWAWPTTEQLTPLILVIALIGAIAIAYAFVRRR